MLREVILGLANDALALVGLELRPSREAVLDEAFRRECLADLDELAGELTVGLARAEQAERALGRIVSAGYVDACTRAAGCPGCDDCFVVCAYCAATPATEHADCCPVGIAAGIVGHDLPALAEDDVDELREAGAA